METTHSRSFFTLTGAVLLNAGLFGHILAAQAIGRTTLMTEHYPSWRDARAELNELPLGSERWKE